MVAAREVINFWLAGFANDFAMYWRVASGPFAEAYLPSEHMPFPYLPTMILWIEPLAWLPLRLAQLLFVAVGAAVFILACRRHRVPASAIALAMFSPPLISTWLTGQVTAILTAVLLWACATSNRLAAGVALGLIASIKPQFVIMAPLMLLLMQDWRALLAAAATFALIVAISLAAFGLDTWFIWFASLTNLHQVLVKDHLFQYAVNPAGAAEYWGLSPLPFLLLGAAAGTWLVVKCRDKSPLIVATAIGCGSLLASPYGLINDLAIVAPFLAWSVVQGSLMATLALSGMLAPLPLLISAWAMANPKSANQTVRQAGHREEGRRAASLGE